MVLSVSTPTKFRGVRTDLSGMWRFEWFRWGLVLVPKTSPNGRATTMARPGVVFTPAEWQVGFSFARQLFLPFHSQDSKRGSCSSVGLDLLSTDAFSCVAGKPDIGGFSEPLLRETSFVPSRSCVPCVTLLHRGVICSCIYACVSEADMFRVRGCSVFGRESTCRVDIQCVDIA